MKIIVAGGTGVIGRSMLPRLVREGHEVFAMTKDSKSDKFLKGLGVTPVQADALDNNAVLAAFQKVQPEVVIHQLTSLGSVNLEDNAKIRIIGTRNLVDASKAVGTKKIIVQSLAFTYEPGSTPATEDIPLDFEAPNPRKINVDGVAALESAAAELPEYVILRYGLLYGPGTWYDKEGMIGQEVLKGKVKATDSIISFLHVEDAAQAAVEALKWPSGPINIVDDEPASGKEWLPVFASVIGAPAPEKEDGSERGERGASNAKAKKEYGWKPIYSTWRIGFNQLLNS
ncbi:MULTISPECIES: NAD-dependent epimerase/dehydratase family protein [Priestia]|uniref:NAD-dependent epimerase/dehydratase family protein n=1 Tax=Priestia TaxID=2800373 RepID=UPI0006AB8308|nr:NAD(P)-dependent oxidoreductase [Priestia megaterium]KOP63677.1 dTDP-glucose 4,6-dehydratase [Bacillus sp. FJAT-21351]KQU12954.1 dTDP-glucose 4,6-dehydratase [Bacillus sp. Leaf75]USL28063.1 NAD(P)-dependent oxidoreductase [Priestia megaterium]